MYEKGNIDEAVEKINRLSSDAKLREKLIKEGLKTAFEKWAPICAEHNCSFAALVEAWALTQYDRMNLLVGMRKVKNVEDTAKCLDIKLSADEIKYMEEVVKPIQVEVLDK